MGNIIDQITCKSCSNNSNENEEEPNENNNNFENSEITTESRSILPQKIIDVKIKTKNFIKKRTDKVNDHYTTIKKLGEGAFGQVFMVENKASKIKRAMKIISKECILNGVNLEEVTNEIKILSLLDHPNIMKIYEFYEDNENLYIISEYCDQGDIAEKMDNEGTLSEFIVRYFMNQIFRAVSYLHSHKIIHGDIKRENILLDKTNSENNLDSNKVIKILNNDKQINQELRNSKKLISKKTKDKIKELSKFEVKLVDFGSAKLFNKKKKLHGVIGTAYYNSPEVIDDKYGEECDEWACGILMYILLAGFPPFVGDSEEEIFKNIKNTNVDLNIKELKKVSKNCKDLISKLLIKNPKKRISAEQALNHPFFKDESQVNVEDLLSSNSNMGILKTLKSIDLKKSKFQDAVIAYISLNFVDKDEESKIKEIFRSLSKDNANYLIDKKTFTKTMIEQNNEMTENEANEIYDKIDSDKNGNIEYQELIRALSEKNKLLSEKNLREAFDFFDVDKSQTITWDEIASVVFQGKEISEDLIDEFLNEIGKKKDDPINFEEFCEIIKTNAHGKVNDNENDFSIDDIDEDMKNKKSEIYKKSSFKKKENERYSNVNDE